MKWINLAKGKPEDLTKVICRPTGGIQGIYIPLQYKISDDNLYIQDGRLLGALWRLKDLEWLDESTLDNNEEVAKEWLKSINISPNANVDQRIKVFPEEFLRYQLSELLTLYCDHITKTS